MDGMTDDAVNLTPRETDILAARLIAKHIVNDSPAVVLWEDVADQTPDPIDVITGWLWGGDMNGLMGESARSASGELLDALTAAGLQIVPTVDDATRQEVPEVLVTFAKWADWYLDDGCRRDHHGYCQSHGLDKDCPVGPMREWLAAYSGRTDK